MIRTTMTMLALGFLAVSDVSAMAATKGATSGTTTTSAAATTKVSHHVKPAAIAANEGAAPAGDEAKPAKEKKAHKSKGAKGTKDKATGTDATGAPAPEAAPQK